MRSETSRIEPQRLYVIGDIHGCADLLDSMIREVTNDLAARVPSGMWLEFGSRNLRNIEAI
jgi:hypothetical protein